MIERRITDAINDIRYDVRPRRDHRGFDLISEVLLFGRLRYGTPENVID